MDLQKNDSSHSLKGAKSSSSIHTAHSVLESHLVNQSCLDVASSPNKPNPIKKKIMREIIFYRTILMLNQCYRD